MDRARSKDNIDQAFELAVAGQAEALAALLAAFTPNELRELERGDYVSGGRREIACGTGYPPLVRDLVPSVWLAVLEAQHTRLIPVLLSAGCSPNALMHSDTRVLTVACRWGGADAVRALLAAGADPNARSRFGMSALHHAPSPEVVDLLVDAGANVDAMDDDGDTPVLGLAYSDDPRTALQLVRRGANPHARGLQGQTLLGNLQEMWDDELDLDVVKGLIEAGYDPVAEQERFGDHYADTNDEVDTFLHSIGLKVDETVREFSEDFNEHVLERVRDLLDMEDFEQIDWLIEEFIRLGDVFNDPWGKDVLDMLAMVNYYPGVAALINAGVRPARTDGENGPTAIELLRWKKYAFLFEDPPFSLNVNVTHGEDTGIQLVGRDESDGVILDALLKAGADPNVRGSDGRTALHTSKFWTPTQSLLSVGADVDAQDNRGCTPIFYPSREDDGVFDMLLADGANPNARSYVADAPPTSLHAVLGIAPSPRPWECHLNPPAAVEALIQHGFDIRFHQERYGDVFLLPGVDTPEGAVNDAARLLTANGADPHHRDEAGRTPLHHAVAPLVINDPFLANGRFMVRWDAPIEALVEAGADLEARDDAGDTPLLAAVKIGHGDKVLRPSRVFGNAIRHVGRRRATEEGKTPRTIPAPDEADANVVFRAGIVPPYETVTRLLALGADVHAVDRAGRKALHYAAAWGSANTVKALLEAGANPTEEDPYGLTPLLAAVHPPPLAGGMKARINEGVIDILIAAGADPHARPSVGITAYEYATVVNHTDRGYQELARAWEPK